MNLGARDPMNVAVLGAGGTIAPAIVRDLAESEEVRALLLLDLDLRRAATVAETHGLGKANAGHVDARSPAVLADQLRGTDVLVNTASYRINLDAMRASLEAGCNYLDLGGLYWMTRRQLELNEEFRRAGLLAVLGIGSSPGKTNLMASRAAREVAGAVAKGVGNAERSAVHAIEVAAAGRDPLAAGDDRLHPPYAIQTLLDELTLAPVVIRDGRPVEIEPLAPGGPIEFGDPVGVGETIYTLHSELATFPDSFGCAQASFRLSLAPALLARLKELIGASEDEVAAAARDAVPPSNQTASVHLVTVRGEGATVVVRALTEPWFGLGGSIVSTAAPAAATVRLLARGSLSAIGVHPPESCINPDDMFPELEQRGCTFAVSVQTHGDTTQRG